MNYKNNEFIGKKFGKLTILEIANRKPHTYYVCCCECGNIATIRSDKLVKGETKSCGCIRYNNLIGNKYGRLTVIKDDGVINDKRYYLCKCECGNQVSIRSDSLISGRTRSCGCLAVEAGENSRKHGMSNTRLYRIYRKMKERCYKKKSLKYYRYGARGITICDEWLNDFESFKNWALENGYQDTLSIDRINNDGNYEPANCRWATNKEQSNNTCRNRYLEYQGVIKTLTQWCELYNLNYNTVRGWLRKNKTLEDIINGFGSTGK